MPCVHTHYSLLHTIVHIHTYTYITYKQFTYIYRLFGGNLYTYTHDTFTGWMDFPSTGDIYLHICLSVHAHQWHRLMRWNTPLCRSITLSGVDKGVCIGAFIFMTLYSWDKFSCTKLITVHYVFVLLIIRTSCTIRKSLLNNGSSYWNHIL